MLALGRRRWRRHRHGDPCEATWPVADVAASAKYAVDLTPTPPLNAPLSHRTRSVELPLSLFACGKCFFIDGVGKRGGGKLHRCGKVRMNLTRF